jgi:hypothetical protein
MSLASAIQYHELKHKAAAFRGIWKLGPSMKDNRKIFTIGVIEYLVLW